MRFTLRALGAVAMLVGFYVLAVGVVAALVAVLLELVVHHVAGFVIVKAGIAVVLVAVALGRGVFGREPRSHAHDLPGVVVTPQEQPRLWAEVRTLADRAGTAPPDEIRLFQKANAMVSDESGLLGLRRGTRRLYLGVPLMASLDLAQLRAVLAHEFGHYSGRHTALSAITYRGQAAIGRVIGRLGPRSIAGRLFGLYGSLYLRVSRRVSRQQELEADRLMAELIGPATAAAALEETEATAIAWAAFVRAFVRPCLDAGCRPDDLIDGFRRFRADPEVTEHLLGGHDPAPEQRSPYDSHPTTEARVAALASLPRRTEEGGGGPGMDLLDAPDLALRHLGDATFAPGLAVGPLSQCVPAAALHRLRPDARVLTDALHVVVLPGSLAGAIEALRRGWDKDLGYRVAPGLPTAERPAAVALALRNLVVAELVMAGDAHLELSWAAMSVLVDDTDVGVDPLDLVQAAVDDPAGVDDLVAWLDSRGIPRVTGADRQPEPAVATEPRPAPGPAPESPAEPAAPTEAQVLAVVAPVLGDDVDALYVTTSGLVLEKVSGLETRATSGYLTGPARGEALLARAVRQPVDSLLAGRHRVVAWQDVARITWVPQGAWQGVIKVVTTDDLSRSVMLFHDSRRRGDLLAALHAQLGDRLEGYAAVRAW